MEHRRTKRARSTGARGEWTEETMPQRVQRDRRVLQVEVRFEMSRLAAACMADAYEQVVPIARRSRLAARRQCMPERPEGERQAEGSER
jgi:hypothetical protein